MHTLTEFTEMWWFVCN